MSAETRNVTWSIEKATPTVTPPVGQTLSYTGQAQALVTAGSTTGGTMKYSLDETNWSTSLPTATASGSYTVYYRVDGDNNWNDVAQQSVQANIAQELILPTQSGTLTYNKTVQQPTWNNYNSSQLLIGGVTSGTNAGTYTATFTPQSGYTWAGGGTEARNATWVIDTAKVTLPSQSGSLTYDGTQQSPTWTSYDPEAFIVAGSTSGTNAGDYTATFTPTANYEWAT